MNRSKIRLMCISAAGALILLCLTGCWNRRELNELAIAAAIGVDKAGDQYRITAQIVNPGELSPRTGGGARSAVVTYNATGDTILEAFRRMTTKSPRRVYLAHVRIVVISEQLAREGVAEAVDFLSREPEIRTDYYIIIAKDERAEEVLKALTPLERIPANHLYNSLEMSRKSWAATGKVSLDEFVSAILSDGAEAVLSGVQIRGDQSMAKSVETTQRTEPPATLQYTDMAVFREDRLVGWLSEDENKGYNYVLGKVQSTVIPLPCPDDPAAKVGIELIRSRAAIKGRVEAGEPSAAVKIEAEANVSETECRMKLMKRETVALLEKETEDNIRGMIQAALDKAKHMKLDIFGFGDAIHRSDPKAWRKLNRVWDSRFAEMQVKVEAHVKIKRVGSVNEPIRTRLKGAK